MLPSGLFPRYTATVLRGGQGTWATLGTVEVHFQPERGDAKNLPIGKFPIGIFSGIIEGTLSFPIHKGDRLQFQVSATPTYNNYAVIDEPQTLWNPGVQHTELLLESLEITGEPIT
jgi:hypothetical protein